MRLVIQRVKLASVTIGGKVFSSIKNGLLVLIGIEEADSKEDVEYLAKKTAQLRIFDDANGVMNCSVMDVAGEILVVSQFTLHAATKKATGHRILRRQSPKQLFLFTGFLLRN